MKQNEIYWTMQNGQKINVDDMDEQHLRNTLKMVLRKLAKAEAELMTKPVRSREVVLNGDMAQQFNDMNEDADYGDIFN